MAVNDWKKGNKKGLNKVLKRGFYKSCCFLFRACLKLAFGDKNNHFFFYNIANSQYFYWRPKKSNYVIFLRSWKQVWQVFLLCTYRCLNLKVKDTAATVISCYIQSREDKIGNKTSFYSLHWLQWRILITTITFNYDTDNALL